MCRQRLIIVVIALCWKRVYSYGSRTAMSNHVAMTGMQKLCSVRESECSCGYSDYCCKMI